MDADERAAAALYPASEKQPGRLRTPAGRRLDELTLEKVLSGEITDGDLGISAQALRFQSAVARSAERDRLADNLERGAELSAVPQEEIFATYELLRPGRAPDRQALLDLARRYRERYAAHRIADLIEDAARAYARRDMFRKRY